MRYDEVRKMLDEADFEEKALGTKCYDVVREDEGLKFGDDMYGRKYSEDVSGKVDEPFLFSYDDEIYLVSEGCISEAVGLEERNEKPDLSLDRLEEFEEVYSAVSSYIHCMNAGGIELPDEFEAEVYFSEEVVEGLEKVLDSGAFVVSLKDGNDVLENTDISGLSMKFNMVVEEVAYEGLNGDTYIISGGEKVSVDRARGLTEEGFEEISSIEW